MRRLTLALCGIILVIGLTTPALAQRRAAMALVVHGIAGPPSNPTAPLDILVDGSMCLGAFEFGDILGPFPFEARTYVFSIGPASATAPCSQRPVIRSTVTFAAGEVASLVTYVNAGFRELKFEKFTVKRPGRVAGNGVVSLFHTAVAPPLDFLFDRNIVPDGDDDDDDDDDDATSVLWQSRGFAPDLDQDAVVAPDMFNGDQVTIAIETGMYAASVVPSGVSTRLFDPMIVEVHTNTVKFLYAVGSVPSRAMRLIEFDWPMNPQLLESIETLHEQIQGE